jgi:hypothetical protein
MNQQTAAVNDLVKVLLKQKALKDTYTVEQAKWEVTKQKISAYLLEQTQPIHVPEEIKEMEPYIAWKVGEKDDESLIAAHMQIDDVIIPAMQKEIDSKIAKLKEQKEELEKYALAVMEQRKCSNFGVTGIGRVENRTSVKYSVADKKLFVDWAVKEHCEDELSISLRPNSKFMAAVVENSGELPAGVSAFRESKAVFVRA